MIDEVVELADAALGLPAAMDAATVLAGLRNGDRRLLARIVTVLENGGCPEALRLAIVDEARDMRVPVLGITGTGSRQVLTHRRIDPPLPP